MSAKDHKGKLKPEPGPKPEEAESLPEEPKAGEAAEPAAPTADGALTEMSSEPEPVPPGPEEPDTTPPPVGEEPEDETARLAAELAETKDKYLRLAAEFDNYRKRNVRQFENIIRTANDELILELISVMDTFELALKATPTGNDFTAFQQGIELIFKQLNELLSKRGLKPIEAEGQPFDPNLHEAIRQTEDADQPSNTVVQEVQKGYQLGDRVIRPAKVVVNK